MMLWWPSGLSAIVLSLVSCQLGAVQGNMWVAKADVVFVLDASDTVGPDEWAAMQNMLRSLVQQLTIGPSNMQIGAVAYGDGAHSEFFFNQASNASQLLDLINTMTFSGGTADAAEAIRFAYNTTFSRAEGMRDGVPHIIVHITDGPSADPDLLLQEAENAHNQGITLFNIGVGEGVEMDHLAKVASDPSSRYVMQADTFTSLFNMVPLLVSRLNNEIPVSAQELPQPKSSLTQADLVLLVDSSSSVGQEDFGHLEDFVKDLIVQLPIGPHQVQIGLVQFSAHPRLEFPLNMYSDRLGLLKAVESLQFIGGGTNTGDALQYVSTSLYNQHAGARPGVPRVAVVITDGLSIDPAKTSLEAEKARHNNVDIIAVGVGSQANRQELREIANDPASRYVFSARNYKDLQSLSTAILNAACSLHAMVTAQPTLPPGASSTPDPCFDKLDNCLAYADMSCTDYKTWALENCRKRCGLCQTAEELACEDKVQDCASRSTEVCSVDQPWAQENCKRFCGFCGAAATKLGFYGKCLYKGQAYVQSERWEDGCDYECVCEDAIEGLFRCYNKCPVYHNLPPECTLVGVPNECCLKPVCNYNQKLTVSEVAAGVTYNSHNIAVCSYNGKQYFQGQTWEEGCNLKCVCVNASLGAYKCQSYCPIYSPLPKECRLGQHPGQCCREPVCEFSTQTGSFTGFGTVSGLGVGMTVQGSQVCVDEVVDCENYGRQVCTQERAWAQMSCAKYCGFCSADIASPGPNDVCYYQGQKYRQGETWKIGCDSECLCEDAVYGYYRCYSSCPSYLNLPRDCQTVTLPGECCKKVECSSGTFYPSSTNVMSLGNGGGLVLHNSQGQWVELTPTLPSGSTLPPGTWGGSVGLSNIRLDGCLFNGQMYIQDQQWHDGCNHACTCQDAATGHFSCRERCPKYDNVPSVCGNQPDPNDPCCVMPDCPASVGYVAIPVYSKGIQGIGAVVTPNLPDLVSGRFTMVFSGFTVARPSAPTGTLRPGGLDYCEYKGQRYHQGERWEDGCDYNCICEDASTGSWRCIDKCEKYVDIPVPYCYLEQDPFHPCCQRPVCNFQVGHNQIEGNNTITTTTTPNQPITPGYGEPKCVYKGIQYAVGQSWYDGCSLKCKCDDADRNLYTCVTRCPSYPDEYNRCLRQPDPQDPSCCVVPVCSPNLLPTPYPGVTLAPYPFPPHVHVIPPGIVTGGNTTGYCEYNKVRYSQDDRWEDGCDYTCVCDNAENGHYTCTEVCLRFGALPATCRLITDYSKPCCQIPTCSGTDIQVTGTGLPPTGSTPMPEVCVYNNAQYTQGQVWQEGCSKLCRCEDAKNGLYVCNDRCPKYVDYPPECTLVSDPLDACCLKPKCDPGLLSSTTLAPDPYLIPTLAPGNIVGSLVFPTPTPGPGGLTPTPAVINYCMYEGVPYGQGDRWQVGCDYNCVCQDSSTGRYECTERCPRYVTIPAGCVMLRDVNDPCCMRPVCSPNFSTAVPQVTFSPTPQVTGPTVSPNTVGPTQVVTTPLPKEVCVYKSESYTQGQKWYDGCDFVCTCEDAKKDIYRCIERCPRYEELPAECHLGPDPQDPVCCQIPQCYVTPLPGKTDGYLIPPLKPGVVSGGSVTPKPHPYNTPTPGPGGVTLEPPQRTPSPKQVCVYNGQEYSQGQRWADGCDYDCQCVDAYTGRYQCTEKCFKWTSFPDQCRLVREPNNPCCETPYCSPDIATPLPQSTLSTVSPGLLTTREPFVGPDGSTLVPQPQTTLSPRRDRCLYNGVPYMTGETWEDGCDLKCVCEDGESNVYRCDQRCTSYQVPHNCQLVTDPEDSCCRVPFCQPVPQSTPGPDQPSPGTTQAPPTGPDGSTLSPPTRTPTVTPTMPPYLIPTGVTGVIIGSNNNPNKTQGLGCVYGGVTYQQGDHWDDGCKQKCVCLSGTAGVYECTERCSRLLNVPPNCQLVMDPADPCCKTALCKPPSTDVPTAVPSLGPQATPVSGQTTVSGATTGNPTPTASNTLAPQKVCVYKGHQYVEGQQWYDGCDKVCECDDGLTNYYRCSDRCKSYPDVPPSCQLVASPEDPTCCMVPQCLPTPGPTGYPTPRPGLTPTQDVYTNPTGVVTGIAPTPTPRPGYPTPGYRNTCLYNGKEYKEGQQWQDGCEFNCVCLNQTTGYYKCVERCPTYAVIPSQCLLISDPLDFCCKKVRCDFNQSTPNPFSPTPSPTGVPDPNLHTTPYPTPGGVTTAYPTPGVGLPTPTNQPPTLAPQFTFCMYNGIAYRQGETWNVGCDQVCTCEDSTRDYYTCADRCPSYTGLPAHCTMTVSPDDACCQVPECYVIPTLTPGVTPALVPGQTTARPPLLPTGVPGVITIKPNTGNPTGQSGCVQNGVVYQPGDTWRDGCQYICECLDTSGNIQCTERCIPYPNIPDYCVLMPDPKDSCCQVPSCVDRVTSAPTPLSTLTPGPGGSTLIPPSTVTGSPQPTTPHYSLPKEVCVYKGASYTEGQQWYDGCDLTCVCEDGKTGFYRCSERCPTYPNVADDCKFVADVRDPACCMMPDCAKPDQVNVTGNVGVITGNGRTPTPTPPQPTLTPLPYSTQTPTTSGVKTEVCMYNGRVYTQGQRWQDGCTYNCECIDASIGQYRCTDRCVQYPQNGMFACSLIPDPSDPCCVVADCVNTPTPPSGGGSTPLPGSTLTPPTSNFTTLAPSVVINPFPTLHPTLEPGVEFCVYKGVPYTHGQTWKDGCDKTCRCEDVVTGQVNCDDRCPTYTQVSAGCQLVTDPQDSCCRVPECSPTVTQNNTIVITGPVGVITGNSLPPNHRGPLTRRNVCIYHGRTYSEGEVWDDGCSYTCQCVDGSLGKYICREKCERIVQLPPTCMMIKDEADQCCMKPYCSPWPGKEPTPEPGVTPTRNPSVSPTSSPSVTPSLHACVYNGQAYRQDQLWYDGCDKVCRCEDADVGFYRCQERCVRYTPDPACLMVPDPKDPSCCEIPKCPLVTPTPNPGVSPTPGIVHVITQVPGKIDGFGKIPTALPTIAPSVTPTPVTGPDGSTVTPTPVTGPDGSTVTPTPRPTTGCFYKGVTYQETQQWEDRCEFVCECVDGTTGKYTCSKKCPVVPDLPERCVLVRNPQEPCCMVPYCDFVNPTPFPNGTPTPFPTLTPSQKPTGTGPTGIPTLSPTAVPPGFCVYNGAYYHQGATWDDGCDQVCACDDASSGLYTCRDRCKSYGQLPPGCVLKANPSDSCCLVPDCPHQPNVEVTPSLPGTVTGSGGTTSYILVGSKPGSFVGTGGIGRPVGNYGHQTGFTNNCAYKNSLYQQNENWEDGCDYMCVCVDALRGKYQCTDRCVSYYFMPPSCGMEPDPADSCCQRARCYPPTVPPPTTTAVVGGVTGTGPSGTGPTNPPGTVTGHTGTGPSGSASTVTVPGSVTGITGTGPVTVSPHPGTGPSGAGTTTPVFFTPALPGNVTGSGHFGSTVPGFTGAQRACVYKGVVYRTGDSWQDGCDLRCTCDDDTKGLYTCTYRCRAYSGLPQYCHLQTDPQDACCKKPTCTVPGTQLVPEIGGEPTRSPTLKPSVNNVIPLGTHTIITGSSRPFGSHLQTIYGGRASCIYKGTEYIPGETWDDGCTYTCTCIGDNVGLYRCMSKCPSYPALPSYCALTTIPGKCCPSLSCDVPNVGIYTPIPQLEPHAKPTAGPDGVFPTPQTIVDLQLILGTGVGHMIGGTGLPGGGVKVPEGYLNNLGGIRDKCIYDLKMYNQGEKWYVACNYTCSCLDAMTGFYECNKRCINYDSLSLPETCTMVANPSDLCCQTPSCPDTSNPGHQITNITQIQTMYPIVGSYVAGISGFRPGYVPNGIYGNYVNSRNGCVYKNQLYRLGETWEDGCDFRCRCIDNTTGLYQCTAKCVTYAALPPTCHLVTEAGQCCPRVTCETITTHRVCHDKLDNCASYHKQACEGPYRPWAEEHCPLYCGFCRPDYTTTPPPCEDKQENCKQFDGGELCTSVQYHDWALDNCRKYCDLCHTTTVATTMWTTPESGCFDAISYCKEYNPSTCSDPNYRPWAMNTCRKTCGFCHDTSEGSTTKEPCVDLMGTETCQLYTKSSCGGLYLGWALHNCRKFCDLCGNVTHPTRPSVTTTPKPLCRDVLPNCKDYDIQYCSGNYLSWAAANCAAHCNICNYEVTTINKVTETGWLVLLKGVGGVTGDVWQLWSTTSVANENVLQAQYLTSQYPGHYKPAIANQWDMCRFERVKVAILSGGVEKANIIFNVRNMGKNDWFRPDNVISSTFTDLPTEGGSFNMARNPDSGNEFAIGNIMDCQGSGWMFVSTNQNCPYQNTGAPPRFYYSLTNTVSQLAPGQLGEGDVFAILAQGGYCVNGLLTTQNTFTKYLDGCFYKGQTYSEGDNWLDGCDLNCTCQDSSTGQYYCIDQCPTYTNLPSECTLQKTEGECCPKLNCPYAIGSGCFYKNKVYPQGATWQDGCDYDCTCNNGENGQYTCIGICQDWSNLPKECHMEDPDPGMCCRRPVCPSPIVVNFNPR